MMGPFFPFPEYRPGTKEASDQIRKAFKNNKRFVLVHSPTGCHAPGTKVIMFDGTFKVVEDIVVGDILMGPDSTPREVLRLYSGTDEMYKIEPVSGNPFIVNKDHILSLVSTIIKPRPRQGNKYAKKGADGTEITNISVIDYLKTSKNWKHIRKLYAPTHISFEGDGDHLPIDPYFLGLLLGDGCLCRITPDITSMDLEIKDAIYQIARDDFGLKIRENRKVGTDAINYSITNGRIYGGKWNSNPLTAALRSLSLSGTRSGDKFIPHKYKVSSRGDRLEMLAGLLDTDGHLYNNTFEYVSKSEMLADDFAFIARSLGFYVSKGIKIVNGGIYYRMILSGHTDTIPTRIARKKASARKQIKRTNVSGFSVSHIGPGQYYGFELDKDHLYMLEDFRITHNSGKSSLSVEFAREFKSVILTPTKLLQNQYAETKEFDQEWEVRGKSNYKCGLTLYKEATVDEAICCSAKTALQGAADTPWAEAITGAENPQSALRQKCISAQICPYYKLITNIGKVPGAILNYDLFFHIKKNPGSHSSEGTPMGEYLVMDEAHQLLNKVKDIFGYKVSNTSAQKILGPSGARLEAEQPVEWLKRLNALAQVKLVEEQDRKKAAGLNKFLMRLSKLLKLEIADPIQFHIDDKKVEIEIKPLNMRYLKGKVFHPFKKILLLSATFPENFCELLGIDQNEVEHIVVPSCFPKENRPVYVCSDMPALNYQTEFVAAHPVVKGIEEIINFHKGEKGIIHCANYKFFGQLKKVFGKNNRFVWVEQGKDKADVMAAHAKTKKDSILVSPSMIEGVDLKDDLARFQIMVKLPFPMLDDYTKKMMKIYPGYYENAVATNITQAYGRAVRTEKDYAAFYILDGAIQRYVKEKKWFSRYFTEAMKVGKLDSFLKKDTK